MNSSSHNTSAKSPLSTLRLTLGFLGLIPFIALALLAVSPLDLQDIPISHPVLSSWSHPEFEIFVAYSAMILSFMAGTLWGKSMDSDASLATNNIILLSNIVALLAWLVLILELINLNQLALVILCAGFCSLLFFEYHQRENLYGSYAKSYLRYRIILTSIVLLSHIALIAKDIQ